MVSDVIQKQIEDIREQSHAMLEGLPIFVLLLAVALFIFFGDDCLELK